MDTVHFPHDKGASEIPREGFRGSEFYYEGQDGGSAIVGEGELDHQGIVGHGDILEGRGTWWVCWMAVS